MAGILVAHAPSYAYEGTTVITFGTVVMLANRMPVSTTHVSCGSLFGIGLVNKKANLSVIKQIILAWILTLPIAAIFAGICYFILRQIVI